MLRSHAYNFHSFHNQLYLTFQKGRSVQNKVNVKGLRIISNHDYFFYRRSGFAQITQHISDWIVPELVFALAAL